MAIPKIAFIKAHYDPGILDVYLRINPVYGAARADFFRYLLMFRVGGVYLDIKSNASQALDRLFHASDRYILAWWPNQPGENFEGWGVHPELAGTRGVSFRTGTFAPNRGMHSCAPCWPT